MEKVFDFNGGKDWPALPLKDLSSGVNRPYSKCELDISFGWSDETEPSCDKALILRYPKCEIDVTFGWLDVSSEKAETSVSEVTTPTEWTIPKLTFPTIRHPQ